ncbi:MAG: hypothetical protein WD708_12095 [Kiritimatiellia bacterium]
MNYLKFLLISTAAALTFLTACSRESTPATEEPTTMEDLQKSAAETAERTGDTLSKAWGDVSNYTADRSDELINTLKSTGEKIKEKADSAMDNTDEASDKAADRFNDAWSAFKDQLDKAGDASEDAWDDTRKGLKDAMDNLNAAYQDLVD